MGKIKNSPGFTLIELVTVSGIMALFSITLISVFMASFRGGSKGQLLQVVRQNGDYAMTSMAKEIRAAEKVTSLCDDIPRSVISVKTKYGSTIVYDLSGDQVASGSSPTTYLTSTAAPLTNGSFNCIFGNLGNQIVTIQFTLEAGNPDSQAQEKLNQSFATSVSTRQH